MITWRYIVLAELVLAPAALVGCYGSRATNGNADGERPENGAERAGPSVAPAAAGGSANADGSANAGSSRGGAGKSGGAGRGSSGNCAAFPKSVSEPGYFDPSAFSGIGGAGAILAGTCTRCGWSAQGDACQTLVASVPTINDPNYYPCLDLSLEFTSCLERERCVCDGPLPALCAAIKARQDTCLAVGPTQSEDADGGTSDAPADWIDVDTRCRFGFKAPPSYSETPVQGTDSCVLRFAAADCEFFADYGAFSGSLEPSGDELDYLALTARIDGRDAELASYTSPQMPGIYVAGVHFPRVQANANGVRLTIVATCKSSSGQQDALSMFRTIQFSE